MIKAPPLSLKRNTQKRESTAGYGPAWPDLPDEDLDLPASPATSETAAETVINTAAPKPESFGGWISERLLSSETTTRLPGTTSNVYARMVSGLLSNRAKMETFKPPFVGEFTLKRAARWLNIKTHFNAHGQFVIAGYLNENSAPEHQATLRTRLTLGPALPWVFLAALPAAAPVLMGRTMGFEWEGYALAAAWVVASSALLLLSYVKTCRALAAQVNKAVISTIKAQNLDSAEARSSRVAITPPRPTLATLEAAEETPPLPAFVPKPQPVAAKPAPKPEPAPVAAVATPEKAPEKPQEKAADRASKTTFKRKKVEFKTDAQALVRAQMQAQLEAQLAALDKAASELSVQNPALAAADASIQSLRDRIAASVERTAAIEAEAPVSALRVRSRIKKFRTRTEALSRPEPVAEAPVETVETKRKLGA